ncbi:MAG: dTDP-4-dehydrorhamnose 3,5-epimerase [Mycolicibacterium sp.]|uniref:dTDP-4-dehydrorhamnose 3,5-epimerase n=1 Tax=Mycolicibacterium sp. TaxID=2320850 RepID=UPI003D105FD8
MEVRALSIPGAWAISPQLHTDARGTFLEWFTDSDFSAFAGHRFDLRQANCSVSAAGVLRGLHFSESPPGQAKYLTCVRGSVFDVVVDIRVGSPTFGRWDAMLLHAQDRGAVYISAGLAHGFLALQDETTVIYLCSTPYDPDREHAISATDPALGIEWPAVDELQRSARDAAAPTLEQVHASGVLPVWNETGGSGPAR